jgi:hypothetical protein
MSLDESLNGKKLGKRTRAKKKGDSNNYVNCIKVVTYMLVRQNFEEISSTPATFIPVEKDLGFVDSEIEQFLLDKVKKKKIKKFCVINKKFTEISFQNDTNWRTLQCRRYFHIIKTFMLGQ